MYEERTYSISEVAEQTGLSTDTLRYYEKIGLLASPKRGGGQKRMYDEEDIGRIRFLNHLKKQTCHSRTSKSMYSTAHRMTMRTVMRCWTRTGRRSRVFAKAGAKVVVPARSRNKAKVAMEAVPEAELGELDLADPDSIDAFAHRFEESCRPLHILVNCAGIMAIPEQHDRRGYELQFATNHLGHFQLTARLWPALKRANGARVVSVSSGGHRLGNINFKDPNYLHRPYNKWEAYGQSKTANALFALELDTRGKPHHVRAFSVHPGTIVTELFRHLSNEELSASGVIDVQGRRTFSEWTEERKTVPEGAATIVWCAVSNQLEGKGGVYCQNIDIAPLVPIEVGKPGVPGVCPWAADEQIAKRLWSLSEELTGVSFTI